MKKSCILYPYMLELQIVEEIPIDTEEYIMDVIKTILTIIYVIVCLVLIVIALMQSKEDEGASGTIVGSSSSSSFYEKNKGRTKEGKLKKWTIILGLFFAVLTIALGIIYMLQLNPPY